MGYDLWRLRTNGLIRRVPENFCAKSYRRLIDPLSAAAAPDAPTGLDPELHRALRTIEDSVDRYVREAQLAA